jgi:SHS2 domain-containing protein
MVDSYEILEHTADIGLLARGDSLASVIQTATRGMAEIAGFWKPGDGDSMPLSVEARDSAGALVDWLNEVLYVQDSRNASLGNVTIDEAGDGTISGRLSIAPLGTPEQGTQIKAVTHHQIAVGPVEGGWEARVFFDV